LPKLQQFFGFKKGLIAIFWICQSFAFWIIQKPRDRTPFSVATPNRFAGLLSVVAAKAEFIGSREKLGARLAG